MSKDPKTRMLDLLSGWENSVSKEEDRGEPYAEPQINQRIHDLYQEVGRVEVMTDEKMCEFWDKIMNIVEDA